MPSFDLLEPCNGRDVHVGLGIRFLSSIESGHMFGAHDLCGTRSIWLCLFLLGLSSSKTAKLKTSHAAPRIRLETPRPSRGVNYLGGYRGCSSGWGGPKRSLTLPLLFRDRSLSSLFLRGDLSRSLCLLGLWSCFFSSLLFSFYAEELHRLDIRASSLLMYFFSLASTLAMLA